MTIIELPETYVAFVLSKAPAKEPTPDELEKLRHATIDYIQTKLKVDFPSLYRLELHFTACEYKANKPEPKFNLYSEAQATAYFNNNNNGVGDTPDTNDVFERFVSAFDRDYLLQKVRKITTDAACCLKSAVEVEARRLKRPTAGGAVKAPAFYMGFVLNKEPTSEPTKEQQNAMLEKAHKQARKVLRETFEDDFQDVSLKIVRVAIGADAGKPDPKYNLYIEFEATAFFVSNAPEPMDVFQAISMCLSTEFIMGLMSIGGPFAFITQMVIRLCIIVEIPLLEEDDDGEGEKEPIIVKIHLEFFIALVVRVLGGMPSPKQLYEFDSFIQDFFSKVLAKAYPKGFVDMVLTSNPEFEAGLPLPRFNMLHQYKATIQFYAPPPDGAKVLQKIMKGNLSALFDGIKGLSSEEEPWANTAEVTMGKAVVRPPTTQAYGGRIEEEEEEEVVEEKKVDLPPPPPPKKVTFVDTPKPPKPQPPAPTKPKPAEIPKQKTITVGTSDVFVAFTIPCLDMEPFHRDYDALVTTSRDFYTNHLKKRFGNCGFQKVDVSIYKSYFNKNKPNPKYNIYLEWDIVATFNVDDNKEDDIPNRYKLCRSLVQTDLYTYLTKHVRALEDTPFAGAIGMFTEQVNSKKTTTTK